MVRAGFTYADSMFNLTLELVPAGATFTYISEEINGHKFSGGSFSSYVLMLNANMDKAPPAVQSYYMRTVAIEGYFKDRIHLIVPVIGLHIGPLRERKLLAPTLAALTTTRLPDSYLGYRVNLEPMRNVLVAYRENKVEVDAIISLIPKVADHFERKNQKLDTFVEGHKEFIEKHNGWKVIDRRKQIFNQAGIMRTANNDFFDRLEQSINATEKRISENEASAWGEVGPIARGVSKVIDYISTLKKRMEAKRNKIAALQRKIAA